MVNFTVKTKFGEKQFMIIKKFARLVANTFLLACLVLILGTNNLTAQTNKKGSAKFVGSISRTPTKFNNLMSKNVGKRVYLKITFDADQEPIGYKDGSADPFFSVGEYSYFLECGEEMNAIWTERCKVLDYNQSSRTLTGYFNVSEPDPKNLRTNRMFNLTPAK